jgi:hypothetical protein
VTRFSPKRKQVKEGGVDDDAKKESDWNGASVSLQCKLQSKESQVHRQNIFQKNRRFSIDFQFTMRVRLWSFLLLTSEKKVRGIEQVAKHSTTQLQREKKERRSWSSSGHQRMQIGNALRRSSLSRIGTI